ncbi:venom carboxylesterase-6 [Procambarus clarkii]|uniref:venom carboxylesterase-6 n=1 Tax=Procambarus clarkii TaxID=6728 RepID=UPI0037448E22
MGRVKAVMMVALVLVKAVVKTEADLHEATVEVHLKQGVIFAAREEAGEGRYFYSFKGIPFAQPPVGDLRFRDPVPAEGWSQPRNGSVDAAVCPEISFEGLLQGREEIIGSEDCLYLNVYTPNPRASRLPVMVWLHGGIFKALGTDAWYPALPLLTRDVVLVVLRYRLGTLGFLSTEDSVMPGNMGLKDQTLALRWVHNNIQDLGGDPEKVTIFGFSAGAASAHFQILSPSAKGLFQRAILQSGSALSSWAHRENHRQFALQLGSKYNCTDEAASSPALESTQLLTCLQKLPMQAFVLALKSFAKWYDWPYSMIPRVDGDFLPAHPALLLKTGTYNKVDIISGFTLHDGAFYSLKMLANKKMGEDVNQRFSTVGPMTMILQEGDEAPVNMARRAYYHYVGDTLLTQDNAPETAQLFTDRFFRVPHEETSQLHTDEGVPLGHSVFKYCLQHRAEDSFTDIYNLTLKNHWVGHMDDIQYLFNTAPTILSPLQRPSDLFMRDIILTLWTNFAAHGNPTPDGSLGFRWWPTTRSHQWYLALTTSPTMVVDNLVQVLEFWKNIPTKQNKLLYPERFLERVTCSQLDEC